MKLFNRSQFAEDIGNGQVFFIRNVVVNDDNPCVLLSDNFDFTFDCDETKAHTKFFRGSRQGTQLETYC